MRWLIVHYEIEETAVMGHYELDDGKSCPNINMDGLRRFISGDIAELLVGPRATPSVD